MNELVIDRPELQAPVQRDFFSALTVVLWMFELCLLLPLATLIAWYAGFTAVVEEMAMRRGWESLVHLLGMYGPVVLVMASSSSAGLRRTGRVFGKRDRRRLRERAADMDVQKMFMIDVSEIAAWQAAKRIVVRHHRTLPMIMAVEAA